MASDAPPAAAKTFTIDPALYIYTSLTAGSSHIVTATSRLETILRANRVPFKALDIATDDKARMLWGRRAGKDESGRTRKLPGLVQEGLVLGDLVEIEEWNEYGELKDHITIYYDEFTQPPISQKPKTPPPRKPVLGGPPPPAATAAAAVGAGVAAAAVAAAGAAQEAKKEPAAAAAGSSSKPPAAGATTTLPMRSIAEEAAARAKQVHLQSLRDKVHGKGSTSKDGDGAAAAEGEASTAAGGESPKEASEEEEDEDEDEDEKEADADAKAAPAAAAVTTPTKPQAKPAPGLQSPTTGAWKDPDALLRTLQSPTSGSWKPTDVEAPRTSYHGASLASASAEEIAAVEKAEAIEEEDEEDQEDEQEAEAGKGDGGE